MTDTVVVDESLLPSTQECQFRVDAFVDLTNTDSALAQFFLQDHDWSVERSVEAYMDSINTTDAIMQSFAGAGAKVTHEPPGQFTILSWNIDGLDSANLKNRTLEVCKLILHDQPDIVFLQEVIPETLKIIQNAVFEYKFIADKENGYFNVTMLRIFTVYYDSHKITPLKNTAMDRNLITVQAHIGSMKLALLNVHLDSTQEYMNERVGQLKDCFGMMAAYPPEVTVIFGGDTNLRDKEVDMVGAVGEQIEDIWEKCGSRLTAKFTWDLKHNTNKQMSSLVQPRKRFDRLFIRYSKPMLVEPINFCIVGVEKVPNLQCFPSDHWGIRSELRIEKTSAHY